MLRGSPGTRRVTAQQEPEVERGALPAPARGDARATAGLI